MSFFAFQDIITGTAGFLIVIAVLLSLDVTQVPRLLQDSGATPEKQKKLDATLAELARMKDRVSKLETVPQGDPESLKRKVETLRDAIASLASSLESPALPDQRPATPEERRLMIEKQKHITETEEAEKRAAQIKSKSGQAAAEIAALEAELQKAEDALKDAISKKNIIRLIPGERTSSKKPVIVIIKSGGYDLHDIDSNRTQQAASLPDLESRLAGMPPASHFLVLFYKPSGAGSFDNFNQRMRALGYEIGYDLLAETSKLEF